MSTKFPVIVVAVLMLAAANSTAVASHIPVALDTPALWTPLPDSGYLNFMTPAPPLPVFPFIATEEHTGWTDDDVFPHGTDFVDPVGAATDGDLWTGDRADFDWVQEHRADELALPPISNHPGDVGFMGWNITPTMASPHTTGGIPHGHSVAEVPAGLLPELILPDFGGTFFTTVDVFSVISPFVDTDLGFPREAALDYFVEFSNTVTGVVSPGVPVLVFVPGWTLATGTDDFVTRWVPTDPGLYNQIAIDPEAGLGHDEVTEIDAVVASPEPTTLSLLALGGVLLIRRRR